MFFCRVVQWSMFSVRQLVSLTIPTDVFRWLVSGALVHLYSYKAASYPSSCVAADSSPHLPFPMGRIRILSFRYVFVCFYCPLFLFGVDVYATFSALSVISKTHPRRSEKFIRLYKVGCQGLWGRRCANNMLNCTVGLFDPIDGVNNI